jgi:hypothetical protein
MDLNADFSPWWWMHTQFGSLVFMMFFLTWGLVIINLFLVTLLLVRRIFRRRGHDAHVSVNEIENIGKDTAVNVTAKKSVRKKLPNS